VDIARLERKRTTQECLGNGSVERIVDSSWYSWRKMEMVAEDRAGWCRVICGTMIHWFILGV